MPSFHRLFAVFRRMSLAFVLVHAHAVEVVVTVAVAALAGPQSTPPPGSVDPSQ